MCRRVGRWTRTLAALMTVGLAIVPLLASPAGATSYVPVYGEGSSWSANAIDQWAANVQQDGMRINYTSNGSTTGREDWIKGLTDFAASDIPFQTDPHGRLGAGEPDPGELRLHADHRWRDGLHVQPEDRRPAGHQSPPVRREHRQDLHRRHHQLGQPCYRRRQSGTLHAQSFDRAGGALGRCRLELLPFLVDDQPVSVVVELVLFRGRSCPPVRGYVLLADATGSAMIAQNGDLGVSGYVSQGYADGAIGYVNYSYALEDHFPVAQMLNAAGYYTEPTPQNVAVSLLADQVDTTDVNDPALYLTQQLQGVYTDPDPRTYPLSEYSYLILPTKVEGQFTTDKGNTLAAFSYYDMCQGQQDVAQLGYSPMPINLVEAGFAQIAKIPGADVQNINIQNCNNPTFTPTGVNLLTEQDPYPPACDKQGPIQCTTGTGGATTSTPVSAGAPEANNPAAVAASGGGAGGTRPRGRAVAVAPAAVLPADHHRRPRPRGAQAFPRHAGSPAVPPT